MNDAARDNHGWQMWPSVRALLWAVVIVTVLIWNFYGTHWNEFDSSCTFLILGFCVLAAAALDVRIGNSVFSYLKSNRSTNPIGFWISVAMETICGGAVVIVASIELFGLGS
ncbi:MAG: hypothetical protein JSS21_05895 [Proteobacteria bacterium]|nr:hypothetical protein [Pseudomonadota bacterium]